MHAMLSNMMRQQRTAREKHKLPDPRKRKRSHIKPLGTPPRHTTKDGEDTNSCFSANSSPLRRVSPVTGFSTNTIPPPATVSTPTRAQPSYERTSTPSPQRQTAAPTPNGTRKRSAKKKKQAQHHQQQRLQTTGLPLVEARWRSVLSLVSPLANSLPKPQEEEGIDVSAHQRCIAGAVHYCRLVEMFVWLYLGESQITIAYVGKIRNITALLYERGLEILTLYSPRYLVATEAVLREKHVEQVPVPTSTRSMQEEIEAYFANSAGGGKNAGIMRCGKCKSDKVEARSAQTRSADEGQTVFCSCMNCGNRWKMG